MLFLSCIFFHFYDVSFAARTHVGTQCKCVRAYKHQVCTSGGSFHTSAGNIDAMMLMILRFSVLIIGAILCLYRDVVLVYIDHNDGLGGGIANSFMTWAI